MTTRHPCICVGALCGLLVLATSASAEGVWVLWSESWFEENQLSPERHTDSKWEILAAAPSSETCEKARREWIRRYALIAREAGIFSLPVTGQAEGPVNTFRPVCHPDTVDPRGPKGQ
jgi:hypothetical protein